MANNPTPPDLFNPVMLWTDLGMRALEMTLSSSQNLGDGLDRLTRAGASVEASELAHVPSRAGEEASAASTSAVTFAVQMQRATFDLMTQAWQQWMNTLGTLASLGAGRAFGEAARQNPWLDVVRQGLQPGSARETLFAPTQPVDSLSQRGRRRRELHPEAMEHALANTEPKRRSRAGRLKPKARSRSS